MTKTKKLSLLAFSFFFLSVFLVRVDALLNVAEAYTCDGTDCTCDEYSQYYGVAVDCGGSSGNVVTDTSSTCDAFTSATCCENTYNGGYWYGDTCNSSPLENGNSGNVAAGSVTQKECDAYGNYNGEYVVSVDGTNCVANTCAGGYLPDANGGCSATQDGCAGYWDSQMSRCYASKDTYCSETMGDGYTMNLLGNCTAGAGSECSDDSNCEFGKSCKDNRIDAPCSNSSTGCVCCTSLTGNCNAAPAAGGGLPVISGSGIQTTTKQVDIGGQLFPIGSGVNIDTGIITPPNGQTQQLTAAQIATLTSNGGLTIPIIPGTRLAGCDPGFDKIGGVCFPRKEINGGLANPEGGIVQILENLFNWLMGIFTTLAVLAFVLSGIQYLMGAGSDDMITAAKKNANNALIGIIVGLSGFIIIQAISAALSATGVNF